MDDDNPVELETESTSPFQSNWFQTDHLFTQMNLKPHVLKIVTRKYEKPLALQRRTLTPCCLGRDILIVAPPSSGKTSSAIISVLNAINFSIQQSQVVFLVPNADTAVKIKAIMSDFFECKNLEKLTYDASNESADEQQCFSKGVRIIIGTPKSLLALFSAQTFIKKYAIRCIILDEAEALLSSQNVQLVNSLVREYLDWTAQIVVLCTAASKEISEFVIENMADPVKIIVNTEEDLALFEEEASNDELFPSNEEIGGMCGPNANKASEVPMELDLRRVTRTSLPDEVNITSSIPSMQEDEYDLLARLIALKLRSLPVDEQTQIRKFLNAVLFDTLPQYWDIEKLVANRSPVSKESRYTQTENGDFCNEKFSLFKDKMADSSFLDQLPYDNVTQVTAVKWISYFEDAPLKHDIKNGLLYDFKVPLFLQQKCLKLLLNGYDMMIQSPPGSGKTTGIIIGALNVINVKISQLQTVIVVSQIDSVYKTQENVKTISQFVQNFQCHPVCNQMELKNYSNNGAHMVITVPEFVTAVCSNADHLKLFAIEEVDEIFLAVSEKLINQLPAKVQVILMTGQTANRMPIHLLTRHFLQLNVTPEDLLLSGVKQFKIEVRNEERRYSMLVETMKKLKDFSPILVFCNTIYEVLELTNRLFEEGNVSVVSLTEKLDKQNFEEFMCKFRTKSKRILISCDYCANIIDIESVPVVINYVMPFKAQNFIGRIRRSGRYKHKNQVVNFVTKEEKSLLLNIQNKYGIVVKDVRDWRDVHFDSNHG